MTPVLLMDTDRGFAEVEARHPFKDEQTSPATTGSIASKTKGRNRRKTSAETDEDSAKRRCVSTACIACRRRKSKCDGALPRCAACSQVYGTECIYDPNSDHRRKGVYKNDLDNLKTRNSTLHTLIQAILNYPEDDVPALIREIRTCESLDAVAEEIVARENGQEPGDEEEDEFEIQEHGAPPVRTFETQLYGKMGDLQVDDGSVRFIGGTSNLIHMAQDIGDVDVDEYQQQTNPITSWTDVTDDEELVKHLLHMYFTWHYTYFTTLSKRLFFRDLNLGKPPADTKRKVYYCTPLLVNAILALGCHFTSRTDARADPNDSATAGDHFFKEAKRLIMANDEHEHPRLTTVQALALMSVREAGCGREAKGWVYSGMSFRMASDMGLNLDNERLSTNKHINGDDVEEDVRRITFWGCYLFDKCWSNYLGRLPQLPTTMVTVPKFEVFPDEDSAQWSPYTDSGYSQAHSQPARTRAVALQIAKLCEISNDLLNNFYNPSDIEKTKGKAAELKKLSDIHTRLEAWRRELPKELEPKEGGLASVLVMHMFFQLLFVHLFKPFLKYTQATSPLPQNVSPRKLCTQAAAMISKLMRLYKRSHGLRQICNIAVYIVHSACTIHLLNLPDKSARRDIVHGVKHLEEIAEGWLGARRTLGILSEIARKWNIELPEEAELVLARTDAKFGHLVNETQSPAESRRPSIAVMNPPPLAPRNWYNPAQMPTNAHNFNKAVQALSNTINTIQPNSQDYTSTSRDFPSLKAQQYSSATPTSASTRERQASVSSARGEKQGSSPSEMFGGVEQLMRDSQDWVMRDQVQFARGFENWTTPVIDVDHTTWPPDGNGVHGQGGSAQRRGRNSTAGLNGNGNSHATSGLPSAVALSLSMANANGYHSAGWPLQPDHGLTVYNEDEWYQ